MKEVALSIDIYCNWDITPPVYRIYVDDDLLTERAYIWNVNEQYIREYIIVMLDPGIHTLKIEPVGPKPATFNKRNFTVNRQSAILADNRFSVH